MTMKTTEISAQVRILLKVTSSPTSPFRTRPHVEVKFVEVFPLAFTYCEDFTSHRYDHIKQEISAGGAKIFDDIPTTEVGVYEVVGIFEGQFALNEQNQLTPGIWKLLDTKVYQLSTEEEQLLPAHLA